MLDAFHAFGSYYFGATTYNNVPMAQASVAGFNFGGELRN
jgi:hypothetical protein